MELLVGTDVHVVASSVGEDGRASFSSCIGEYTPNLHCSCYDRILGGNVGLNTKDNELSYTKMYEVQGLEVRKCDRMAAAPPALRLPPADSLPAWRVCSL